MKISRKKRQENIEAIFEAAKELSKDRPFAEITMRELSKKAGLGEATIYKYFPKKDDILLGFFSHTIRKALSTTKTQISPKLKFSQQLHLLVENHIEELNQSRLFFADVFGFLFANPLLLADTRLGKVKEEYVGFVQQLFRQAVERGEFNAPSASESLLVLFWDCHIGFLYYWSHGDTEEGLKTTELVDLTTQLVDELLRSNLVGKLYDVGYFLFRHHILGQLTLFKSGGL